MLARRTLLSASARCNGRILAMAAIAVVIVAFHTGCGGAPPSLDTSMTATGEWWELLVKTGALHEEWGEYPEAIHYYEQALANTRSSIRDRRYEGVVLVEIGRFHARLGDYGRALETSGQALTIFRKQGERENEWVALNDMAGSRFILRQYDQALEDLRQASQLLLASGHDVSLLFRPMLEANRAAILARQGHHQEARHVYEQALAAELTPEEKAGVLFNLASVLGETGQPAKAARLYSEAIELLRPTGERDVTGAAWQMAGVAHESQGDSRAAINAYRRAVAIQEEERTSMRLEEFRISIARQSAELYQRAARLELRLARPEAAFELTEQARARIFLDQLVNTRLDTRKTGDLNLIRRSKSLRARLRGLEQELATERAKPIAQQDRKRMPVLDEEVDRARREYERLRTSIKISSPVAVYLTSRVNAAPVTLPELQALLDAETTILSYFLTPTSTLAFVVGQKDFHALDLPVARHELARAVREFRGTAPEAAEEPQRPGVLYVWQVAPVTVIDPSFSFPAIGIGTVKRYLRPEGGLLVEIPPGNGGDGPRGFALLDDNLPVRRELYDRLIRPLRQHLKTRTVGIVPSGVLHYLPFVALNDGQRDLGDEFTLFSLPSATILAAIAKLRKPAAAGALVLAYGNAEGLPPLRHAEQEARQVARALGTQPLAGAGATESRVKALAGGASIVHLAAHAQLNRVSPLASRIILAPDSDNDGSLEVEEILTLALANTRLVVLSGCQTQLGGLASGDDLIGLNRAFMVAGVPTVVASLWSVDDEVTSGLMTAFYTNLGQGMDKAGALQAAQAQVRAKHPHPYYWAAFVLTGDPR